MYALFICDVVSWENRYIFCVDWSRKIVFDLEMWKMKWNVNYESNTLKILNFYLFETIFFTDLYWLSQCIFNTRNNETCSDSFDC